MDLAARTLTNAFVRLEPLAPRHRDALIAAAHADVSIFAHMPYPVAREGYGGWFDQLMAEQSAGRWIAHAVVTPAGVVVGQTCFLNPRPELGCVEVGGTWYARQAQGTAINPAAKLLMFSHAFACGAERVELKTDALNTQSRRAMEKLGLTFEGVMRRQMRRPDGSWRDNAWFSVVAPEWPALQTRIEARLHAHAA
ncbi:MAG: GNAT family N-acetyltransferase [Hyphomonadaceae bacterium]|nr:GNAT family N-acetyltransferase [Hyphomonadaceae bacterium]